MYSRDILPLGNVACWSWRHEFDSKTLLKINLTVAVGNIFYSKTSRVNAFILVQKFNFFPLLIYLSMR
jgi:hypothetical protein